MGPRLWPSPDTTWLLADFQLSSVHVAASLFHDIEPCAQMGIPAVCINRRGERSSTPRTVKGGAGRPPHAAGVTPADPPTVER
ncbi:MAG TPA: hypothetical protein VM942_01360 [Acidimicrobiales bacterium]|nr:hypothetical protein [Acidimicrobiales bacterium]